MSISTPDSVIEVRHLIRPVTHLGHPHDPANPAHVETNTVTSITGGNFRLIERLMTQVRRLIHPDQPTRPDHPGRYPRSPTDARRRHHPVVPDTVDKRCQLIGNSHTRVDVNGVLRQHLNLRKVSFAAMDAAVAATDMEYGGITPIGLPGDWPILIDRAVTVAGPVVLGSGRRASKIVVDGAALATLPRASVLDGLGLPRG